MNKSLTFHVISFLSEFFDIFGSLVFTSVTLFKAYKLCALVISLQHLIKLIAENLH